MASKKKAGKKKVGRPPKYSPDVKAEICRRLAEGEPLVRICRDKGMPAISTVWSWEREDPEFSNLSARGREDGTHTLAHECLVIADEEEDVHRARLKIDTRIRLIGKWNRKIYGDKLGVENTTRVEEASKEDLIAELSAQLEGSDMKLEDLLK